MSIDGNTGALTAQMIIMAGGAVAAVLGGMRIGKNWAPGDMAIQIAETYNQDVTQKIVNGEIK